VGAQDAARSSRAEPSRRRKIPPSHAAFKFHKGSRKLQHQQTSSFKVLSPAIAGWL